MGRPHRALHPGRGGDHATGDRNPRRRKIRRRPLAARSHPPRRGARSPDVRNSGRRARRSRRAHPRRAERGPRRRESEHRDLPPRPAAARGRHRDDAGRPVRAARRADPPRGPLHSGRQGAALLHGADAGRPGPRRRLRGGHPLHPRAPRRHDSPRNPLCRRSVRRRPHLLRRRGAGRGGHGLRHGEHPARRQDFRSRQPLCHQGQATGRRQRRGRRPARRALGGAGAGRRRSVARLRRRRPAVAGRTRRRQPGGAGLPVGGVRPRHPAGRRRTAAPTAPRRDHPRGTAPEPHRGPRQPRKDDRLRQRLRPRAPDHLDARRLGRRGADHRRRKRLHRPLVARKRRGLRLGNQPHAAHGRLGAGLQRREHRLVPAQDHLSGTLAQGACDPLPGR